MTSAPAIGFEYRPSRQLAWLRRGVVVLAVAAVLSCGLSGWLKLLLVTLVVLVQLVPWRRREIRPVAAGWSADGGWTLRLSDGRDESVALRGSRVFGGCVMLKLAGERRSHGLWLFPDNSDADTRRRLRMRLDAMGRGPAGAGT